MKRTKVIALVLCAAIMLMGAGYAIWSETVTITTNVSTGNLSVELLNGGDIRYYPSVTATEEDGIEHDGDGIQLTATGVGEDKNTATVTLTNLYPGARVEVSIPVKNDGSIPVKLEDIGFDFMETADADWITVSNLNAPATLAKGAQGYITFKVTISDDANELDSASFNVIAEYVQFNK